MSCTAAAVQLSAQLTAVLTPSLFLSLQAKPTKADALLTNYSHGTCVCMLVLHLTCGCSSWSGRWMRRRASCRAGRLAGTGGAQLE